MRALSPWVCCAFDNVYVIVHSPLIVEEKIIFLYHHNEYIFGKDLQDYDNDDDVRLC